MFRRRPRWLCAHILTLLVLLAAGIGALPGPAFSAEGGDERVEPEAGGGGGYGDPDQPQEPPKLVVGGDPEYTVYTPMDPGTNYGSRFGGVQAIGGSSSSLWKWRVRFLIAGLRYYLRF